MNYLEDLRHWLIVAWGIRFIRNYSKHFLGYLFLLLIVSLMSWTTSDVTIRLRNRDGRPEYFFCHSLILKKRSKFFSYRLSNSKSQGLDCHSCIEVHCSGSEYDHHVKLLKLLYISEDCILDSWDSVKTAIGVLRASVALSCDDITRSCIQYLEAVPWDDEEEEEILRTAPTLGPVVRPILARIHPVDLNAVKNVFLSAICVATTINESTNPFSNDLKTSAQEQVEYMLLEDSDTPLVTSDKDVESEVKMGLSKMFSTFEKELSSLSSHFDDTLEAAEQNVLQSLSDLEWMCNILPKMDLMKDFVMRWAQISGTILSIIEGEKFYSGLWAVKSKLIEVAGKTLEAVGYGNVFIPAPTRVHLLKIWLNYIRKMKPKLDSMGADDATFQHKMDDDLCQSIEGAITSLVLALPSSDQADILNDWMNAEQLKYPDLSEAFEVWCYRTKTAKRRLVPGLKEVSSAAVSLRFSSD